MPDATRRSPIPTAPGGVTETTLPGQPPRRDGLRLGDGDAPMVVTGDAAPTAAPQSRLPDAGIAFDADTPRAAAPRRDRLWMATADRLPCAGPGPIEARGAFARGPGDGLAARP